MEENNEEEDSFESSSSTSTNSNGSSLESSSSTSTNSNGSNDDNAVHFQPSNVDRVSIPVRQSTRKFWSAEERKRLAYAIELQKDGKRNWKEIAEFLPGRSKNQCCCQWKQKSNQSLKKGLWTQEEDKLLIEMIKKLGNTTKWTEIAKGVPGRNNLQCRSRWVYQSSLTFSDLKRTPWSEKEDLTLLKEHNKFRGNKWSKISKALPGRSHHSVMYHWNSFAKRKSTYSSPATSGLQSGLTEVSKQSPEPSEKIETSIEELSLDLSLQTPCPTVSEKRKRSSLPEESCSLEKDFAITAESPLTIAFYDPSSNISKPINSSVASPLTIHASLNTSQQSCDRSNRPQSNYMSSNYEKGENSVVDNSSLVSSVLEDDEAFHRKSPNAEPLSSTNSPDSERSTSPRDDTAHIEDF